MEPVPLPVVDLRVLSPKRPVRRVIGPHLECGLVVLVSGGTLSSVSLELVSTGAANVRHVWMCTALLVLGQEDLGAPPA